MDDNSRLLENLELRYGNPGTALPFAINTATVLLAIEIKPLGHMAAIRVALPQVGI